MGAPQGRIVRRSDAVRPGATNDPAAMTAENRGAVLKLEGNSPAAKWAATSRKTKKSIWGRRERSSWTRNVTDTGRPRTSAERSVRSFACLDSFHSAANWSGVATLVLSPGIPHSFPKPHAVAERARAAFEAAGKPLRVLDALYPREDGVGFIEERPHLADEKLDDTQKALVAELAEALVGQGKLGEARGILDRAEQVFDMEVTTRVEKQWQFHQAA